MNDRGEQPIVSGISISASGEATVDSTLTDVLFDLAIKLEAPTNHPVDVQHVLAAVVLAARSGELTPETRLRADDEELLAALIPHVMAVFANYDGKVGQDD